MKAKLVNTQWEQPPEFPQLCRFLAERSPQPMVAVEGLTHIVRYANGAFRELLGKEDQHLIGRPFGEAVPEGMANGCGPLLDRVFATGKAEALAEQAHGFGDVEGHGGEMSAYWSYLVWPILGAAEDSGEAGDETTVGVMIQVTDATDVAEFRRGAAAINEALLVSGVRQHELMGDAEKLTLDLRESEGHERVAKQEAEGANRTKDLFLATLSHELRTPLNAIVGWISILRREGCDAVDLREGLDVIERNTQVQVQLIEDVLDISRIVSGKLRLEIGPCELTEVVKAGMDVVRAAAEAKNITLTSELDSSVNGTLCDGVRMQQVMWNLLSNAVKFTQRGGAVNVDMERGESAVIIRVSDNGQGMGAHLLPFVFDRFRQADSSTRRKFGGLGLGLSIVKQLVEMHGGTIMADSAGEGTGSTFTIQLPIRAVLPSLEEGEERVGNGTASTVLHTVRLDGLRLLVVDDQADARRLLSKVLETAGATVMVAGSAAEAMKMLRRGGRLAAPHVLVSDIGMPEENGFDLIGQVRKAGYSARDLPAVALTAFANKDDQRKALLAGFQVHVPKPADPHDLAVVIASLAGMTGV
jgi:signal transduction histidine kinase/ActR/RegA family two-component response regulator